MDSSKQVIPIGPYKSQVEHFRTHDLSQFFGIKDALFKLDEASRPDAVIVVDWRTYAESATNFLAGYDRAAKNTYGIGRQLAYLLFALRIKRGLRPEKVHLIGFSLGAQVVGTAARKAVLSYRFREKLGRVTGLDPAGPRFQVGQHPKISV